MSQVYGYLTKYLVTVLPPPPAAQERGGDEIFKKGPTGLGGII